MSIYIAAHRSQIIPGRYAAAFSPCVGGSTSAREAADCINQDTKRAGSLLWTFMREGCLPPDVEWFVVKTEDTVLWGCADDEEDVDGSEVFDADIVTGYRRTRNELWTELKPPQMIRECNRRWSPVRQDANLGDIEGYFWRRKRRVTYVVAIAKHVKPDAIVAPFGLIRAAGEARKRVASGASSFDDFARGPAAKYGDSVVLCAACDLIDATNAIEPFEPGKPSAADHEADVRSARRIAAEGGDDERRAQLFRKNHPLACEEASAAWGRLLAEKQAAARAEEKRHEVSVLVQLDIEEWE